MIAKIPSVGSKWLENMQQSCSFKSIEWSNEDVWGSGVQVHCETSDRWQNQNWNLGTRTPRTNIPSKSVAAWCWTGGQTNIADSRFVFITLIMSNKRGEQYFIDNFRAGLEPTQGKNYKTSPKWPGARSDQPGSNCYDHEIVSRNREKYFQIKLTPPPASLATKPKPL